ncbi:MAG: 23S rRNA (guanosine(2251)-2'-O)-methyltransferase RlmB [Clostridia bacterium]|nr:23S rRNA (guanosine(2251)-2'-O)-methyltransferase RlmB [Clostridiales bacterium]MBQ7917361.1 23S rRNA (guanosine(2251)-2'-O)-methyltransferase RlmB [Clostridia bacterium]
MKAEGKNPVRELLNTTENIEKVMIVDGTNDAELRAIQKQARDRGLKVEFADRRALDKLSETGHHQGVIAIYSDFKYADLKTIIKQTKDAGKDILFVVLDEVLDPHNLGSVIRVAECAGATGVIIPNRRSATVNETVVRTSAGATAYMPVIKVSNLNQAIEEMKENNIWVYAADMDGEQMYKTNLKGDIALVIGGEGTGVKQLTRKLCDGIISIPMYGKVNSLNASVSAGIVLYEAVRQRI